jgi:hypothetical protein
VNEGSKYPITIEDRETISCPRAFFCATMFGKGDLGIYSDSNNNTKSYCHADGSFKLPKAEGSLYPSINGGKRYFKLKKFEVYKVYVRITINIIYRNKEKI